MSATAIKEPTVLVFWNILSYLVTWLIILAFTFTKTVNHLIATPASFKVIK